jgi:hypothetical protein
MLVYELAVSFSDPIEGCLRPFSAAGGLRPGIYAGLARVQKYLQFRPVHGSSRCDGL